ncbi:MAG: efflux RND transporter periplasmic adaptor subunit [Flavonifractor sp.]|nr:efflux RND transporter periplasmic adaptor subunit [Flavonifractor sp.]
METTQVKPEVNTPASTPAPPKKFTPPKKRGWVKWVRRLVILAVLAGGVVFLLAQCQSAGTQLAAGAYLTETAQVRDLTVSVSGTGPIEPIHSYRATTLVSGEVLEAPFEEGQTVSKDDLLFRIDAKDVEDNIQQLESNIRQQELNLRAAQLNLEDLLERQEDNQEENAKEHNLESNATGVVTEVHVEVGDTISIGAPVADVLDREHMKLTLPFHAADAAGFYTGQTAQVTVDGTLEVLTGAIDELGVTDQVGPGGSLVRQVTIRVDNPGALSDTSRGTASVNGLPCASGGTFTYAESKQITAKESGEIETLNLRKGDWVTDGQIVGSFKKTELDDMDTQIENARIQIENARIQVENAQISLQNARDRLEDYTIRSTITGTVIEKNVDVGDNVGGSASSTAGYTYMAVIYDLSALTFDVRIDELDINKIQVGQKVEITADALDGEQFTGTVDKVNINGTTAAGVTTYPVTVKVDGTPAALKPGMNISAKILVEHAGAVLTIPVDAVKRGNEVLVAGPGCLDENGNVADLTAIETRQVTLGRNDEDYIEVLDGLEEGEVILIENQASNMMAMMMGMGG